MQSLTDLPQRRRSVLTSHNSISSAAATWMGLRREPSSLVAAAEPVEPAPFSSTHDLRRSGSTTGRRLAEGLKRRFSSLRRRKSPDYP